MSVVIDPLKDQFPHVKSIFSHILDQYLPSSLKLLFVGYNLGRAVHLYYDDSGHLDRIYCGTISRHFVLDLVMRVDSPAFVSPAFVSLAFFDT